jgi:16S rRNA (cytosine967-C5)-methyltransferase
MKLRTAYEVLSAVIRGGAYSNLALNEIPDESERAYVTRTVYGVLEHCFELDAILSALSDKRPKPEIRVLLMLGLYCLRYSDMPDYAAVNETVELCKSLPFAQASGFVNSVMNRAARREYKLSEKGKKAEEIRCNLPYSLIELIKKQYPRAYRRILVSVPREEEHVRLAAGVPESVLQGAYCEKTITGYYVKNNSVIKNLYEEGKLTYQGFTSTLAVLALGEVAGKTVLDLCAAPGGKSVFLAERGAKVTGCDIFPQRVALIESYAKRMNVRINTVINDGTSARPEWHHRFDAVLIDAPCSGLGALSRRKDIVLNRSAGDIATLSALQKKLIEAGADAVAPGGTLVYSTCTILKEENGEVVFDFMSRHPDFVLEEMPLPYKNKGELQFLPDEKGTEGFYIARLRRKKD